MLTLPLTFIIIIIVIVASFSKSARRTLRAQAPTGRFSLRFRGLRGPS